MKDSAATDSSRISPFLFYTEMSNFDKLDEMITNGEYPESMKGLYIKNQNHFDVEVPSYIKPEAAEWYKQNIQRIRNGGIQIGKVKLKPGRKPF